MLNLSRIHQFLISILFCLATLSAHAEQADTVGNYKIHYNAINSTLIQPKVASQYKILRSRFEGVINIAVQKKIDNVYTGTPASLSGTASNLLGQQQKLTFTEIHEGKAIYYLSNFHFSNEETFKFKIDVKSNDGTLDHSVKFQRKFFTY